MKKRKSLLRETEVIALNESAKNIEPWQPAQSEPFSLISCKSCYTIGSGVLKSDDNTIISSLLRRNILLRECVPQYISFLVRILPSSKKSVLAICPLQMVGCTNLSKLIRMAIIPRIAPMSIFKKKLMTFPVVPFRFIK